MRTNVVALPASRRLSMEKSSASRVKSEETRNSKKKKGTALVVSKKVRVAIEADFGKHAPKLIKMLEMDSSDGALTLLKKKLLQTSVGLLPFAERTVRDSQSAKGVYQFSTLVSQIREIIGDIEADRDREMLMQVIDERVIKPAFMDIAHEVVMKHYEFRKELETMIRPENVQDFNVKLKRLAKVIATDMQTQYQKVTDGLEKALKN